MGDALVGSRSIRAVKVVARLGPARFDAALATAGITLDYDREGGGAGLAFALGGVGVDLETLARAYVAFANAGMVPNRVVFMPGQLPPFLVPSLSVVLLVKSHGSRHA